MGSRENLSFFMGNSMACKYKEKARRISYVNMMAKPLVFQDGWLGGQKKVKALSILI